MQPYKLFTESIEKGELKISGLCLEVENAIFLLITEKDYRVSTMAGGIPGVSDMRANSFRILGTRNMLFANALAERMAHSLKKFAFISLAIEEKEATQKLVLELVNEILRKVKVTS